MSAVRNAVLLGSIAFVLLGPFAYSQFAGQRSSISRLGIFWTYNVNQQRVSFTHLPGVPNCCPEFTDAVGTGHTAGALLDLPLSDPWMLSIRFSYGMHDATVTATEQLTVLNQNTPVPASIRHAIDAKLATVDFDLLAGYRLFAGLSGHLGTRLGFYVRSDFEQEEKIVEPSTFGTFENGKRVRNEIRGAIPDRNPIAFSLLAGVSYHLPLDAYGESVLAPEVYYILNLTEVAENTAWHTDAIHIGLSVKFALSGDREKSLGEEEPEEESEEARSRYWQERRQQALEQEMRRAGKNVQEAESSETGRSTSDESAQEPAPVAQQPESQPQTAQDTDKAVVPQENLREMPPPVLESEPLIPAERAYEDQPQEPKSTQQPEAVQQQLEAVQQQPEAVQQQPEAVQQQPEAVQQQPEAAQPQPKVPAETAPAVTQETEEGESVRTMEQSLESGNQQAGGVVVETAEQDRSFQIGQLDVVPVAQVAGGEETIVQHITAEEFGVTDVVTLLNYIYFAENSSDLSPRLALLSKKDAAKFRATMLDPYDKMRLYANSLNIVGSRLREYPESSITIMGCNSNNGDEAGRLDLSRRRAEAVRDYLRSVWDIDDRRITLVSQNLPEKPSLGEGSVVDDENRRVELYSDTWEILRPIVWSKNEWKSKPGTLYFKMPAVTADDVERWRFTITQGGTVLKEFSGSQVLPSKLEWNIAREQPFNQTAGGPFEYVLRITTPKEQKYMSRKGSIPVTVKYIQDKRAASEEDVEFTRYHLIVFDKTEADYKTKVVDMVTSIFGVDANISVQDMSELQPSNESGFEGLLNIGDNDAPLDMKLPEGRMYSRALGVIVETAPQDR